MLTSTEVFCGGAGECTAVVDGGVIDVSIQVTSCRSVLPSAHGCGTVTTPCQVPPLSPGRYVVVGAETHQVEVVADGGIPGC